MFYLENFFFSCAKEKEMLGSCNKDTTASINIRRVQRASNVHLKRKDESFPLHEKI